MIDSAKFILSKKILIKNYNTLKELCDQASYSAKTNYEVAKILEESTDSNFSIHGIESLDLIKDKSKVWFLAQAWDEEEINILFEKGVKSFIVDNEKDLGILLDCINDRKINLLLRLKLKEHTIHTGKYFVFGMSSDKINKLIPKLRENNNIENLGIHFHRKTQNLSEWSLKYELESIIDKGILEKIDFINIGGGIPVRYKNFSTDMTRSIFSQIKEFREWLKSYNVRLIIESGRYIAASCVKLQANIKNIYENNIIINCSVYNTAMDTFIVNNRLEIEGELEKGDSYTIKGQTPCSMDIFRYRAYLKNPKIGDKIVFLNAGAYNFSSDFCNLKKLKTYILE